MIFLKRIHGVAGKTMAQFDTAIPIFAINRRGRELLL